MEVKFFVNQKKHNGSNDSWDNNVHVKNSFAAAMHQFHAFMSTYGYEQDANIDYCACSVTNMAGVILKDEVDKRTDAETE